jgi:uncharacterized protein (DUF488 family)
MIVKKICTIGDEGASLEDFIATLNLMKINKLIDVREFAISRKKGFSKTVLRNSLALSDIQYQHEKLLGSPKEIRHRLRKDHDYAHYFSEFRIYLETQDSLLNSLSEDTSENIVLMCYERDSTICHRSVVSEKLGDKTGIIPIHLGVQKQDGRRKFQRKTMDTCQSLSAA